MYRTCNDPEVFLLPQPLKNARAAETSARGVIHVDVVITCIAASYSVAYCLDGSTPPLGGEDDACKLGCKGFGRFRGSYRQSARRTFVIKLQCKFIAQNTMVNCRSTFIQAVRALFPDTLVHCEQAPQHTGARARWGLVLREIKFRNRECRAELRTAARA